MSWRKLPVSLTELCLDTTLRCGQSFRWRKSNDDIWSCAIHGRLLSLKQDHEHLYYRVSTPVAALRSLPTPPTSSVEADENANLEDDTEAFLRHYLNLGPNLGRLYEEWSAADANFKRKAPKFTGVRILKQDAWEALVGFICSSNNNISRISQMVEKLCIHYGARVGSIGTQDFHDMPTPDTLTDPRVEAHLRELGFGYRARYLHQTARMINEQPPDWLEGLRNPESPAFGGKPASAAEMLPSGREGYRAAHEQLLSLQGVGPKVADCVCLMGLGWGEAVPVDTHIWQIAVRDYKFGRGKHSSLTKATYDAVGNYFRALWGKEAGWAHSVLFTADLRAFSERLTTKIGLTENLIKIEPAAAIKIEVTETIENSVSRPKRDAPTADKVKVEEITSFRTTRSKRRRVQ